MWVRRSQGKLFLLCRCSSSCLEGNCALGSSSDKGAWQILNLSWVTLDAPQPCPHTFSLLLPCLFLFCSCFYFLLLPQLFGQDCQGHSSDVFWRDSGGRGMDWKEMEDLLDIGVQWISHGQCCIFLRREVPVHTGIKKQSALLYSSDGMLCDLWGKLVRGNAQALIYPGLTPVL